MHILDIALCLWSLFFPLCDTSKFHPGIGEAFQTQIYGGHGDSLLKNKILYLKVIIFINQR